MKELDGLIEAKKLKGIVVKRDPDSFRMADTMGGPQVIVDLTGSTEVKSHKRGLVRGSKEYGASYILIIDSGSTGTLLRLPSTSGYAALIAYLCSCALIIGLGTYARASQHRADEANRRKNEFLAILGHELRNPLAAIGNAQAILRQRPASAPEA